ncbi:hypothetical protein GGS23DRAFT_563802 [Durotheca rogersii]|uniref:uncharacterized protein n=1 Tax=Durotheca rogersii TaxID=419775 RepID=UPI00221FC001|nr:uncharacterized protein GGS23DRAFT_563802 [Durotheca rogersii]KAI5864310.1 hypothetical protein GGS23DRAFT_563802 [Durotheca rogersii]
MASRYSGSRYDGDSRRSRSRDRSPDRRSLYSDGGPRRSSAESRSNSSAFQTNRDSFRDALPRDTPRGPKALLDAPSGPRGGGYSGDFRGRGRGRGRGWRDDSRDRGRDREIDFRDRRDNSYRDDRSRERDRGDWRDRDRDNFRARRPSPRGRSPPGRDFRDVRDLRDAPLGVDAERARRGSRDGPLSAGSSSSDPPFGPSSYRGAYGNRGRGRGRGDWDRGRGRSFYDDRDRYGSAFRSRSQEGRYRDRDDRDRDGRYLDADLRSRDPRDDRDARDRDVRPKLERASHEPPLPLAKDVSPPPVAPAAPSFGSVPNRTASITDIGSATGKTPPTGPRALKDERATSAGSIPHIDTRMPPTGPSRPFLEMSPSSIPFGLRSQTRPGPSSKQWINPNIKNRVPESPKLNRSQSFAQPRPPGLRPEGGHSDQQGDSNQRPHSSDAKSDSQLSATDRLVREPHGIDVREEPCKTEPRPPSAGSSFGREPKLKDVSGLIRDEDIVAERAGNPAAETSIADPKALPVTNEAKSKPHRRPALKVTARHISLPRKEARPPILDQSSESDDEEFGDVIESGMAEVEKKLKQLRRIEDVPVDVISRYAAISLEAITKIMNGPEGLEEMVGPIPDAVPPSGKTPTEPESRRAPSVGPKVPENVEADIKVKSRSPEVKESPLEAANAKAELPQPSIEQDIDMPAPPEPPPADPKPKNDDGDVTMEDVLDARPVDSELQRPPETQPSISRRQSDNASGEESQVQSQEVVKGGSRAMSVPGDDEDETDVEDIDSQSIEIVREHKATPPLESLPYFDEKPWYKDDVFLRSMDAPQPSLQAFILNRFKDQDWARMADETEMKARYDANYTRYLRFTLSDDPVALKSRAKFTCVSGSSEASSHKPGFHESKPEGTRRSRYASERDLERILEESRRVEDEKRERQMQAERERYRTEKEAVLPRQYQVPEERENDFYRDVTGLIQAEKTVAAWQLLPPVDNFTEEETASFEKAYLEFPKQWGRVSDPLPNRDFGTSIQFYYLRKEKSQLNLKEKLKKRPRQRKKGGRGKQRSSALVSELRTGDNDTEETQDTGENGERRRPRRAAAPTFNSEATPATDGEGGTPNGTPGRRGAGAKGDGSADKSERKPRGRRAAKDKEPKQSRVNQTLAAAPPATTKSNRSRSSSRAQGSEWASQQTPAEPARGPAQYELAPNTAAVQPVAIAAPFPPAQAVITPERGVPPAPAPAPTPPASQPDAMAPPPLRPEPPQQPSVSMIDLGQTTTPDRRSGTQASSYWSVPEANDFPQLLRAFGSDWAAIAAHMRTKTPVMVKNYFLRRKDAHDWEGIVHEADGRKLRGEKRPAPPIPSSGVKKRYEPPSNRPLASADTIMEDAPAPKLEHQAPQPTTARFNVPIPIAAQPQPTLIPSSFVAQAQPPMAQSHTSTPPGPQPLQLATQASMSPVPRPARAPLPYAERDRELPTQQPARVPTSQKAAHPAPSPAPEPHSRHPLPTAMAEPQPERPKVEPKAPKEQPRHQDRQPLRVKQEPDMIHQYDHFTPQAPANRMAPSRAENMSLSRPPEPPRATVTPQAPFATMLQQSPHGRSLLGESHPSPPARPRPIPNLSRPQSRASGGSEPFSAPPAQPAVPVVVPAPSRPPERKTSNLMALLNDDPLPAPPKRVTEIPSVTKPSSTPPPQSNLSRPPPPPPPSSQVRRESAVSDAQVYGYSRNPPPAPSAIPSLKPYTSGSPQAQPVTITHHMPLEADQYYNNRTRSFPSAHQPPTAGSPQAAHRYPPPNQPPPMSYQAQPSFPYGAQVPPPSVASPPPQYGGHPSVSRGHEPPQSSRDAGWPGAHQSHHLQHQSQPPPPQTGGGWPSHPPQPPKSTQPPPTQSAWAAQHAPATAPKPPPPSSSVPPQPSWATAPPPPRGHDPMALRDVRDIYQPHRMQAPLQAPYTPGSRAPEPPQAPAGYPRYANTPVPGRDPRDPGPPRSYTPVSAYDSRGYPPPGQELRDVQLREQMQQRSILQPQLRPQDNRHLYDHPPDRYGR